MNRLKETPRLIKQFQSFIYFVLVSLMSQALAQSVNVPNWSTLEQRLYENPTEVLATLEDLNIESWTDAHKVQYYNLLTDTHFIFSEMDAAQAAFAPGWALKDRADPYTLVSLTVTRAYFKERDGDLNGALADYNTALRLAEQSGLPDAMMLAINALISFHSLTQENYETALLLVERGSQLSSSVTREFLVADLYNYFGSVLSYLGDNEGAFTQYGVAEEIYRKLNNHVGLSNLLYNRASLYDARENYISAIRAFQAFMAKAMIWGDPTGPFFGNMGLANSYRYLERYDQAYESVLEAQRHIGFIYDPVYLYDFWSTAGYIAIDVDDIALAEKAVTEIDSLLPQLVDTEASWYHIDALDLAMYLSFVKEDFESAYYLSEDARWMQYGLMEQEQLENISMMRIQSENAMFQSETDRLAIETRQQQEVIAAKNQLQQVLTILLIMFGVSVLLLAVTLRRKVRQMRILQQYSAISESVKSTGQQVMDNVAGMMFEQSEQRKSPLSVVMFDFPELSDVREDFGQQAVDDARRWIQEALESELRDEDKCGQVSFGRYMLLLPGAEARLAKRQADRYVQFFKSTAVPNWPNLTLNVSAGITERTRHDRTPNVLTHRAATAVDMARDTGKFNIKILAV